MIREISNRKIVEAVKVLSLEANFFLGEDVKELLNEALRFEESPLGREVIRELLKNARIAAEEKLPICQDTGTAIVFVEIGQDARITGGDLHEAINEGISRGYKEGFLRKSMVENPLKRKNTGDNTPAMIYTEIVSGNRLMLTLMAKGAGAENCSQIKMLRPTAEIEEIENFVLEVVRQAGPNACPPIIVGIGLGGTFETAPLLAKKAILRDIRKRHSQRDLAKLEKELLKKINSLGIGPAGLGGRTTALAVNIESYPCHIGSLPVAVNLDCHAHRVKTWLS